MVKVIFKIDKGEEIKNLILFSSKYDKPLLGGKTLFERLMIGRKNVLSKIRNLTSKKRKTFIRHYIEEEYKKLNLEKNRKRIENDWSKIEKQFFRDAEKLFDNHKWPSKKYFAYLSILSAFPRYLEQNKFFVPKNNKKRSVRYIAIHELLHFLFYDFYNTNFQGRIDEMKLWHFSEIFNAIILDEKPLRNYYKDKVRPYPLHYIHCKRLKPEFTARKSMKEFFDKAIIYIKKQDFSLRKD